MLAHESRPLCSWQVFSVSHTMAFVLYRFPAPSLQAVENCLRTGGFKIIQDPVGHPPRRVLRLGSGLARADVVSYTSHFDAQVEFHVVSGRNHLAIALLLWPIDCWLVRRATRYLVASGAKFIDPHEIKNG